MQIKPEELSANGYMLLDSLGHKELVPFVQTYIKKRTFFSRFYYTANIFIFALSGYFFVNGYAQPGFEIGQRFTQFSYGILIAFLLIPLHEYIHVLAYRWQGAKHTSYDVNLKKFYFMALADKFVASKKEFQLVALAPFLVITSALTILLFLVNANWTLTIMGTLLTHTAMCAGDFGLLSYFQFHKTKEVVTYDDVPKGISYFYGKEHQEK
jgi:hypothetical protein